MEQKVPKNIKKLTPFFRTILEVGFILFLFYSNLLMGEFTHANSLQGKSLLFAMTDIFTIENFIIAVSSALVGYVFFEYLREKF